MTLASQQNLSSNLGYIDVNTNFRINNLDILVPGSLAIANQIINVLSTYIGERTFEPEFGSNLPKYLFEPIDDITSWRMETDIFGALARWVPRIQVLQNLTRVIPLPQQAMYSVSISYIEIPNLISTTVQFTLAQK